MAVVGKHSFSWTAPSVRFLLPCLAGLSRGGSCEQGRCAPGIVKLVTAGGNATGDWEAEPRAGSRGWHLQSPRKASAKTAPRACQGLLLSGESAGRCDPVLLKARHLPPGMACLICFKAFGGFPVPKALENGLISPFQSDTFHGYPSSGETQ